jgi:hypothetical protein
METNKQEQQDLSNSTEKLDKIIDSEPAKIHT